MIIAGGANPNHKDKIFYQKYVKRIEQEAKNSEGKILVTGFVDENKIEIKPKCESEIILFDLLIEIPAFPATASSIAKELLRVLSI